MAISLVPCDARIPFLENHRDAMRYHANATTTVANDNDDDDNNGTLD